MATPADPSVGAAALRHLLSGYCPRPHCDGNGVVFLMNVESVAEADTLLTMLPLGHAKLLNFELIPVGPLSPLGMLIQ